MSEVVAGLTSASIGAGVMALPGSSAHVHALRSDLSLSPSSSVAMPPAPVVPALVSLYSLLAAWRPVAADLPLTRPVVSVLCGPIVSALAALQAPAGLDRHEPEDADPELDEARAVGPWDAAAPFAAWAALVQLQHVAEWWVSGGDWDQLSIFASSIAAARAALQQRLLLTCSTLLAGLDECVAWVQQRERLFDWRWPSAPLLALALRWHQVIALATRWVSPVDVVALLAGPLVQVAASLWSRWLWLSPSRARHPQWRMDVWFGIATMQCLRRHLAVLGPGTPESTRCLLQVDALCVRCQLLLAVHSVAPDECTRLVSQWPRSTAALPELVVPAATAIESSVDIPAAVRVSLCGMDMVAAQCACPVDLVVHVAACVAACPAAWTALACPAPGTDTRQVFTQYAALASALVPMVQATAGAAERLNGGTEPAPSEWPLSLESLAWAPQYASPLVWAVAVANRPDLRPADHPALPVALAGASAALWSAVRAYLAAGAT